jgi:hypothetical protein
VRLWSLHPRYLDAKGLVALWREALLAKAVLDNKTRGYTRHPQLERFRSAPDPSALVARYLAAVLAEADARGYAFDRSKCAPACGPAELEVSKGQLAHERAHLLGKLRVRDPGRVAALEADPSPEPHPLFRVVAGPVAGWEKGQPPESGPSPVPAPRSSPMRPAPGALVPSLLPAPSLATAAALLETVTPAGFDNLSLPPGVSLLAWLVAGGVA